MNKKGEDYGYIIIVGFLIMFAVVGCISIVTNEIEREEIVIFPECVGEVGMGNSYDCCKDCSKLDLNYFRYKRGGILVSSECYCLDGMEVIQIY